MFGENPEEFFKERSCFEKKQYTSMIDAESAIRVMKARGVVRNETIHAYPCEVCGMFHVGHERVRAK